MLTADIRQCSQASGRQWRISYVESANGTGSPNAHLLAFGLDATLGSLGGARVTDKPASPDNGVLAGHFGPIGDPGELAQRLAAIPGVVEHGLFPPATGGAHHLPG